MVRMDKSSDLEFDVHSQVRRIAQRREKRFIRQRLAHEPIAKPRSAPCWTYVAAYEPSGSIANSAFRGARPSNDLAMQAM